MEFNKHLLRLKENNLAEILKHLNLQVEYKICTFVVSLNCRIRISPHYQSAMFSGLILPWDEQQNHGTLFGNGRRKHKLHVIEGV